MAERHFPKRRNHRFLRSALTAWLLWASACRPDVREDPLVLAIVADQQHMENRLREVEAEHARLSRELVRVWGKLACTSDAVREFLRTCEQEGGGCSSQEVANTFTRFLETQNHVRIYLRPEAGIEGLIRLRQTQLENQTDPAELHPGTRFVVITLPQSSSTEHQIEAERMGRQVIRYLRETLNLPLAHRILGPKTLPCQYKRKEILKVTKRIDDRQLNEPTERDPTVHVWVFRTDCH
jgi:hypothetical protein